MSKAPAFKRIFYAASAGNLIGAHHSWRGGTFDPTEVSLTFSSQVEQFCADVGAKAYLLSNHRDAQVIDDGDFILEHRPKPAKSGIDFHLGEIAYAWSLLKTARAFKADVAIIDSGVVHYFLLALFRLFGIAVVPVLHNTVWPAGYPPQSASARFIQALDRFLFWRRGPLAVIAVSPECERQAAALAPGHRYPVVQIRAQFRSDYFVPISPPDWSKRPFTMLFIGRLTEYKGVLDIAHMAHRIEEQHPSLVRWIICGRGPASDQLATLRESLKLHDVIDLKGWTSLEDLQAIYSTVHACIVPTRSSYAEGLAMTTAEAVLAGRPFVSNPVVPGSEVLADACVTARTDDIASHADAVLQLVLNKDFYAEKVEGARRTGRMFLDRSQGLTAGLHTIKSYAVNNRL